VLSMSTFHFTKTSVMERGERLPHPVSVAGIVSETKSRLCRS
jgi:hypothetical protein